MNKKYRQIRKHLVTLLNKHNPVCRFYVIYANIDHSAHVTRGEQPLLLMV